MCIVSIERTQTTKTCIQHPKEKTAKSIMYKLQQREQFAEEMNSIVSECEHPKISKTLQFSQFFVEEGPL